MSQIDVELSGTVLVSWRCPRCGRRQGQLIDAADLPIAGGKTIACAYTDVCGRGLSTLTLEIRATARHNGLLDD